MKDYYSIGKIAGAHGLTGEVVLQHALGIKTDLKGLTTIFLEERKGSFLPYFIEHASAKNEEEVYLKIEGFHTRESVRRINQKEVWLTQSDFEKYTGQSAPIKLLGYQMLNDAQLIGQVLEVIEQPMQILCRIIYRGNEALIPLHEQTLKKIDHKRKEVHVSLPEGLLDLYA